MTIGAQEISKIRDLIHLRLEPLFDSKGMSLHQSILMVDNLFWGIKFRFGPFSAVWRAGQSTIQVEREGTQVMLIDLNTESTVTHPLRKAA